MDPINIIAGLNLIATFGANLTGAKKGLKSTITAYKEKPKTYLQKLPLTFAMLTLLGFILGIFQIGTFDYTIENQTIRIIGLLFYLFFSWFQVWAFKVLGENYSQDILILKNHSLVKKGPFKSIRHPQYLAQILMDLGAGILTLSYIVIPIAIIQIPFIIMRASLEEKLLEKHLKEYGEYKKKSGFMIPFIG